MADIPAPDADPHVRLLAVRDLNADPALIAHLTTDPDPRVRKSAARCPRLPADRLTALLNHPELAADAAANQSLDWKSWASTTVAVLVSSHGTSARVAAPASPRSS